MLTDQELRQAFLALSVIEDRGDPDELAYILRQARDAAPSADRWGNATLNQEIGACQLAAKAAALLGEPRERCEAAAAEIFAPQRQRAVFDALIRYAGELTKTGTTVPKSYRPTIRIIADERGVA